MMYIGFEPFWTKKSYSILSVRYYAIIWILAKKNSPPDIYDLIPTVDSSSFSKLTSSWCCLLGFISDSWSYSAKCITFVDIVDSELKGEISLLSTNTYFCDVWGHQNSFNVKVNTFFTAAAIMNYCRSYVKSIFHH